MQQAPPAAAGSMPPQGVPPPAPPPVPPQGVPPPIPPPAGVPPPLMPPMPGFFPPIGPRVLPTPSLPEPPTEGPGFPYPQGGSEYAKAVGDQYYYTKTESYQKFMREAENRVTLQLSYLFLREINENVARFVDSLDGSEIVLLTGSPSLDEPPSVVRLIFEANCIKHKSVTPTQLVTEPSSDENTVHLMPGQQVLIIADAPMKVELPESCIQAIRSFVENGGICLSFNSGVYILEQVFPNRLRGRRGETTADKPMEITILPSASKELFDRYDEEVKVYKQLVRRKGMVRFAVLSEEVQVLLKEHAPEPDAPLAVRFSYGRGEVYHSLTSHIVSKVGAQGGTMFQGLGELSDLSSKELAEQTVKDLKKPQPNGKILRATQVAWRAAFNAGFHVSINTARSLVLTLDFMFELLRKYVRK